MALTDRPDFQAWLRRFETRHERLYSDGPGPPPDICDGCGEPLPERVSSTGLCLVCLAEQFGREQTQPATRVAATLLLALMREEQTSIEAVRDALDDILAEVDRA